MLGLHRRRRQQLVGGVHGAMLRGRSSLKKRRWRRGLGGGRAGLLALWLGDGRIWREEGKGGKWWLPSSWTWKWRWEGKPASPGQVWKAGTGGKVTRKAPLPLIYLVSGYTCCTGKRMRKAVVWSIPAGILLILYLLYSSFAPSQSERGRQPKIWISLSVCLGNATDLYHKVKSHHGNDV